ncbi:MAG: fibronectin type III domain-containing protein [Burkholderiaceae bacterium]
MRRNFKLNRLTAAVMMATAALVPAQRAFAGPGFVDATATDGVTIFRSPTYFTYSPSGVRVNPVVEGVALNLTTDPLGAGINTGTALRKFVDPLAKPMTAAQVQAATAAGTLPAKYIPIAQVTKWVNPQGVVTGDDYYEIAVVEYTERFHTDLLKPTTLRGYVQIDHEASNGRTPIAGSQSFPLTYPVPLGSAPGTVAAPIMIKATDANGKIIPGSMVPALSVDKPRYLGPVIASTKDVPARVKFLNLLPAGRIQYNGDGSVKQRNGDLFLPVDPSIVGAGFGPDGLTMYTQNRANIHLHGGDTPWISDGLPHQWLTPAEEANPASPTGSLAAEFAADPLRDPALLPEFLRGASTQDVPDMNEPGAGAWTLYFPNAQTARMLWYHDHSVGTTRLNVYAGMASAYLLTDATEQQLVTSGALPPADRTIPLVLQDRTFVPADIALQDAMWSTQHWGAEGDSWFPHVYETVQAPNQLNNTNATGRWHYGPLFWPISPALYPLPSGAYGDVTTTPEAWMDTPIVNGVAYPTMEVDPTTYRFRVLNASNDRMMTFNILKAVDNPTLADGTVLTGNTGNFSEVDMVAAGPASTLTACAPGQLRPSPLFNANGTPMLNAQGKQMFCQPELWPADGRLGGMPDPNSVGPALHQIASEGGWLPAVHSIEPNPVTYIVDKGRINVFNVNTPSLQLAPAERADMVIDFSQYAGQTLIVYNDSGAPVPAGDPRNDTFTGVGDQSGAGGAEDTKPGFGPNIRTMMQIKVKALAAGVPAPAPLNVAALNTAVSTAYLATQERPVVAQPAYAGFDPTWAGLNENQSYARIQTGSLKEPVFNYTPGTPSNTINSVQVLSKGGGYITAPAVTITPPADPTGRAATAKATLQLERVNVATAGSGYMTAPTVSIVGGGGNGATAEAKLGAQAVVMTAGGAGYTAAATVTFTAPPAGGRRATGTPIVTAGAITGVTITDPGTGYVASPLVSFTGGTGARATSRGMVTQIVLLAADPQAPASAGGGGFLSLDPAAVANPFTITLTGGLAAGGVGATATATGKVFDITLDYAGRGYAAAGEVVTVTVAAPAAGTGTQATARSDIAAGTGPMGGNLIRPKAIQELFDATYGRLNATLGVELPFTSAMTQTTVPLGYVDEPTERFADGETQIWKITHNGVDSHPVHFHLLNVQLVNRVDWAGIIMPPKKNELGWKETVVMNPLEDIIVAVRATTPKLPGFGVPLSVRAMDPSQPLGSPFGFTQVDGTTGTPKTVVNDIMNYGWEYVWHCHILGHEENDFMRPVVFNARETTALASTGVTTTLTGNTVAINWVDATPAAAGASASSEVGFRVQRGPSGKGVFEDLATDLRTVPGLPGAINTLANAQTYSDDVTALMAAAVGATPPAAPTAPTTGLPTFTSVTLNWTSPAPAVGQPATTGFDVMREELDAAGLPLVPAVVTKLNAATLAATVLTYTDATAVTGSKYQYTVVAHGTGVNAIDYRVVSVNVVGETPSAVSTVTLGNADSSATSAPGLATTPMMAATRQGVTYTASVAVANAYDVAFTWNAPTNAANYMVRSRTGTTAANGTFTAWAPQTTTTFTATVPLLRFLTVEVQAVSTDNVTSATLSSGAMQVATPTAPNGLTFTALATTANSLTLNWNLRPNATSYTVEYATDATFTANLVTVPGVATNTYAAVGLNPNTRYYFRVRAVNTIGTSNASATANSWTLANAVAAAPTVAANLTGTTLTLNWTGSVGGAAGYTVQQSTDGGATWAASTATVTMPVAPATAASAAVRGLLGLTDYQFRVVARNGANVLTLPSPVLAVTTVLAAPSAITAGNGIAGGIITGGLNFTGNNSANARYEIRYRNTLAGSPYIGPIVTIPGEQVNVGGAARNIYMQVRAVNNATGVATAWLPTPAASGQLVSAR